MRTKQIMPVLVALLGFLVPQASADSSCDSRLFGNFQCTPSQGENSYPLRIEKIGSDRVRIKISTGTPETYLLGERQYTPKSTDPETGVSSLYSYRVKCDSNRIAVERFEYLEAQSGMNASDSITANYSLISGMGTISVYEKTELESDGTESEYFAECVKNR